MTALVALLALVSAPDLTHATDQLFHHSDVKAAAQAIDQFLEQHPDDAEALELGVIAHAALGDDGQVNALAARRAARGDARALPVLLFAWERAHTPHKDAERLLAAAKKLLPNLDPATAAPLKHVTGQLDRMLGRFDVSVGDARLPGQVLDWQIVGPFENDQNSGFDAFYPPERGVDLTAAYAGKTGEVRWRSLPTRNWDGTFCFELRPVPLGVGRLVSRDLGALAERRRCRHLGRGRRPSQGLGQQSPRRFGRHHPAHGRGPDSRWDPPSRRLESGPAQGCPAWRGWAVGFRITDPRGKALKGMEVAAQTHPTNAADDSEKWPVAPEDPILSMLSADGAPPTAPYLKAWRLLDLGQARAARLAFEVLARAGPSCALCSQGIARAALEDEDRDRALTALGDALDLDPAFAGAAVDRARIHQAMGLDDRAEAEAKAAMAANPGNTEALAVMAELRLKRGFAPEAARLAQAADQALPGWAAYGVVLANVALAQGDQVLAESVLREVLKSEATSWHVAFALFTLLKGQGRLDEAAKICEDWLAHDPQSQRARQELASVRLDAHEDSQARSQIAEFHRRNPDDPTADRLEGDLDDRRGDREGAIAAYRRALNRNPPDWGVRDHLQILEPSVDVAAQYQVSSAEIRRRAKETTQSDHPGANAVVLLREESTVAHDDGSMRSRVHFAVKVFDQAGIDQYLNYDVGKPPNIRLEQAGTLDRDGVLHEVSSIDNGQVHFPVPRPESTFEISYSYDSWPRSRDGWWQKFSFQEVQPVLQQRWIVALPKARKLQTWKRGPAIQEQHESLPTAEVTIFDARNEPPLPDEPDHPPEVAFRDLAVVSTFPDWEALTRWVRASVDDQLALDVEDPEVKALAAKLTADSHGPDQKVAALAGFVRNEIHYNQADTDIYRWRAHPARRVLETHYGDCKDKATLFEALAQNAGLQVEHSVLLVNLEGTTPTEIPTNWFNHAVAYLPPQPGLTRPGLLDLTAEGFSVQVTPFMDQDVNALGVRPGTPGSRFERIPFSRSEDARRQLTLKMDLQASGSASGTIEGRMGGLAAADFRHGYRDAARRAGWLDGLAGLALPRATRVGKESLSGLNEPERDVDVVLQVEASNLLRQVGEAILLKVGGMPDVESWIQLTARQEPLRMGYPLETAVYREIALPRDLRLAKLPEPVHFEDAFFSFDLASKRVDARTIAIDTHYQRKVAQIPAAQFGAFRKAAVELQHASDVDVVLHPAVKPKLSER